MKDKLIKDLTDDQIKLVEENKLIRTQYDNLLKSYEALQASEESLQKNMDALK